MDQLMQDHRRRESRARALFASKVPAMEGVTEKDEELEMDELTQPLLDQVGLGSSLGLG